MTTSAKSAIVVGASQGIGAACVKELHKRGYLVAAVARRAEALEMVRRSCERPDRVSCHVHDVLNTEEAGPLFGQIVDSLGGLDMLVYAAGIMPHTTPETYDTESDAKVIATNLTGCISWCNPAAEYFTKQGRGHIVGISSIAGDRGRRGYPAYNTSKAGMNTFLEALRNRAHRHGVRVTTIKPGYVKTDMTKGMEKLFWVAEPDQVARELVDAAESGKHTRYVLRRWGLVGAVIKSVPSFIFRRTNI